MKAVASHPASQEIITSPTAFNALDLLGPLSQFERRHAPETLYLQGDPSLLTIGRRVAVVGSRSPSEKGVRRAGLLSEVLVQEGFVVVSGLALGIDTIAHETAMAAGGRTIAVLGTPLDVAYPARNRELLDRIRSEHLAVSQFPVGYPQRRENFPQRNRTMALISDATVIVEASETSGTRHQGWEALRLGRMVFLMQNVVDDPALTWPSEMIRYGAQVLTRDALPDALAEVPGFTSSGIELAL
jgi:DNA processing protein